MRKTKDLIMADYSKNGKFLDEIDATHENYSKIVKERDDIRKELIEIVKVEMENETKKLEIENENKREKIRNRITLGTFAVTSVISIWAVMKTFKFDEEGTVTSTLGRGILSGIMPKFRK